MEKPYNRNAVINYARKWAFLRNPKYLNYDPYGGDCTNFASQCIYAGSKVMNYSKRNGWFYINGNNKSASWTGVEFLYNFLVNNRNNGPIGKKVSSNQVYPGDLAQLSFDGRVFGHSLIILNHSDNMSDIEVSTHTYDSYGKKIGEYEFSKIRFVHIEKVIF